MSHKATTRVVEHSRQRGALKLLLLILADFAGADGLCWPGIPTLAEAINESERHTIRLLKQLQEADEIASKPGRGRGHMTMYAVLCGLSPAERDTVKGVLQNTILRSTFSTKGDMSGKEKVTSGAEKVTSGADVEGPITPPPSPKTPQNRADNHHDPSWEPSDPSIPPTPQPPTPSAGWVDGGSAAPPEQPGIHPESIAYLTAQGAKSPKAIRSAARLPLARVKAIVAEDRRRDKGIGASVNRCIAEADSPDIAAQIAAASATPPARRVQPAPLPDTPPLSPAQMRAIIAARQEASP